MKRLLLLLPLFVAVACPAAATGRPLFDGTLSGWDTWLGRPDKSLDRPDLPRAADGQYTGNYGLNHDPLGVFSVRELDGGKVIHISGEVFGALTSKEEFSDYHLTLEYKWGETKWAPRDRMPRDSGLLFHCVGPHGVQNEAWMRSLEFQILEGQTGDFFSVGGGIADIPATQPDPAQPRIYTPGATPLKIGPWVPGRPKPGPTRCNRLGNSDFEVPAGGWNRLDLYVVGDRAVHVVNGRVAMVLLNTRQRGPDGTEIPLTRGRIQLQSEGAELFYRDLRLSPLAAFPAGPVAAAADLPAPVGWDAVPTILARIVPPEFPARDFDIREHGAVADGHTDASKAIARAIAACHAAGGGRVVVPPGIWPTGPIHLKSNVNLHVAEGATLLFSPDPARYPRVHTTWEGVECMNYSPLIYAFGQENVAVTGKGVLDGSASYADWWDWKNYEKGPPYRQVPDREALFAQGEAGLPVADRIFGAGRLLRPSFIQPYRCRNVLIEGVTIRRAPFWVIHPVQSRNLTIRGVTVDSKGPNNDGCDPESCADVLIEDCTFNTGDDCIALKSGRNNDGRRIAMPAENIVIRRCHFRDGHGGLVIGSEISGACRNIFAEDCIMDSPRLGSAVRLKNNARRGATIENVFVRRITVARVAGAILNIQFGYEEGANGPHIPILRNLKIEHITSREANRVVHVQGIPRAVIEGVRIAHADLAGIKTDDTIWEGADVTLEDVTIRRLEEAGATPR